MMVGWHDLREKCKTCGERAAFSVEYTNDDLPKGYIRDGTRLEAYCLHHLPEEVSRDRQAMMKEAQRPFGI